MPHFIHRRRFLPNAFLLSAVCCLLTDQCCLLSNLYGQNAPHASRNRPISLFDALQRAPYEEDETGPILAVSKPNEVTDKFSGRETEIVRHVLDAFDRKFVNAGAITAIAPRRMTIINPAPGRAKIFANLEVGDRMKLLLASLTPAQWRIAGDKGISLGDLSPDQQEMFATFLPPRLSVQKNELEAVPEKPNSYSYKQIGEPEPIDLRQLRLQIGRRALYEFSQVGKEDSKAMSHASGARQPGATLYTPVVPSEDGGQTYYGSLAGANAENNRGGAFGIPILQSVPSAIKPGDLDFAAPALNVRVPLSLKWKTLGDALNAARRATGLEIHADRRVRDLILCLRTPLDFPVRAGDLLKALSMAITGTYRRLDASVFVLTDDVEGIGTRLARLDEWAGAAEQERYDRVDKAVDAAAQNNPLPFLKFFPDDENALPAELNQRMEAAWTKEKYAMGIPVSVNELPPHLRRDVEKQAKFWNEDANTPIPVRTDKIVLGAELAFAWRLPEGGTLDDSQAENGYSMGFQFLGRLAPPAPKIGGATPPTATPNPATPKKPLPALPDALKRRALIIAPTTPDEAKELIESGAARGIREFWVMKTLDVTDDAPLKAAIAAAKSRKLPVFVCVTPLRFGRIGQPERNILGQTGDEWFQAQKNSVRFTRHPEWWSGSEWEYERWRQWIYPAPADLAAMEKRLLALTALPGIAGIAFKNVAAPGYAGKFDGGDGIYPNGFFGYTLPMRLAFLREKGVDPIDIVEEGALRDLNRDLPFFPCGGRLNSFTVDANGKQKEVESPAADWRDFRYGRAARWLIRLHAAVKTAKPDLPQYVSDRASDYTTPYAEWFGLWGKGDDGEGEALPQNPVFAPEGEGRAVAKRFYKIVLKRGGWDKAGGNSQEPEQFAGATVGKAKEAAVNYDGLAIDLSQLSAKDALRLLSGLAETSPTRATVKASP